VSVKSHLEAAAAYIAVAESSDAKRAAYERAADEILAALAEDPALSQAEVGRRLSKSPGWVGKLLGWRDGRVSGDTPFARDPQDDFRARHEARKVPTRHEDRVEMAETLLADPEVVKAAMPKLLAEPSKSRRFVEQAVSRRNADERKRQIEEATRRRDATAAPLPAFMARMVAKMNDWSGSLAGLYDDLDELPEGRGRELVAETAAELARQAQRWVDRLERRPQLEVIEGQARRPA
jgi:hypothetical protein